MDHCRHHVGDSAPVAGLGGGSYYCEVKKVVRSRPFGILATCLLLGACGSPTPKVAGTAPAKLQAPTAQLDGSTKPIAFTDDAGVVVEVVALEVAADEPSQALLHFSGIKNEITGLAIRARVSTDREGDRKWVIQHNGADYTVMVAYRSGRVIFSLPKTNITLELRRDKVASAQVDAQALVANHVENTTNGKIAKVENIDRVKAEKFAANRERETWEHRAGACQLPNSVIQTDWSKHSDASLHHHNHCTQAFSVMGNLCSNSLAAREQVQRNVKRVICTEGKDKHIKLTDGTIVAQGVSTAGSTQMDEQEPAELKKALGIRRVVLKSESGVVVVIDPDNEIIFAGNSKELTQQTTVDVWGRTREERHVWEGSHTALLKRTGEDTWTVACKPEVAFKEVPVKERDAVLDDAKFGKRTWKRTEFALARDDSGTYYYVDRLVDEHGGAGYRVFRGPRGSAKKTGLVDIVRDSHGTIFATTSGKLRLVIEEGDAKKNTAFWIKGKKRTSLTLLPTEKNLGLIYDELGVYSDVSLGTLCTM